MKQRRFYVTRRDAKKKPVLYEGFLIAFKGKTLHTIDKQWDKKKNVIKEKRTKKTYASEDAVKAKVNALIAKLVADGYVEVDDEGKDIESKKERPKISRYVDAMIRKIESYKKREEMEPTMLLWRKWSKKAAPDARELLDACVDRHYQSIFIGDYVMTEDDHVVPFSGFMKWPRGNPKNWVIFGHSQRGDMYAMEVKPRGKTTRVIRLLEKERWRGVEEAKSLEEFFRKIFREAKKEGAEIEIEV